MKERAKMGRRVSETIKLSGHNNIEKYKSPSKKVLHMSPDKKSDFKMNPYDLQNKNDTSLRKNSPDQVGTYDFSRTPLLRKSKGDDLRNRNSIVINSEEQSGRFKARTDQLKKRSRSRNS